MPNFYPRPPRGGRPSGPSETSPLEVFLSTPSARRATFWGGFSFWLPVNFYPRPPRGGRPPAHPDGLHIIVFLSTPSARRATAAADGKDGTEIFLSTPSARRATARIRAAKRRRMISIHALREEGDTSTLKMDLCSGISIHALREEGDLVLCAIGVSSENISIHALREEGDSMFSPPSARFQISIHALREEGDPRRGGCLRLDAQFLSTPSARRATISRRWHR